MTRPKMMIIPVTPFQQNCSVIWNADTNIGAVVDPGGDVDVILHNIEQAQVSVEKIILTHGHIDHAGGAAELRDKLNVPIEGPHTEDDFLLKALPESGAQYGYEARAVTPDRWLKEGDKVTVGALEFSILECPGHTPGSVVLFSREHHFCLMGDVLFQGSIGRTDFPYGNHEQLLASIRDKLLPLGDEVWFVPGHGPASSIGEERRSNPFLAGLS